MPKKSQINEYSDKSDWRIPIMKYLTNGRNGVQQIKEGDETYFIEEANYEESKIYIAGEQIKHLIKREHDQNDWHNDPNNTIQQVLNGPYWWPTILQDTN